MNKNLVTVNIDRVSFKLKEQHDFEWLKQLGTVFCMFAEQDSGNLAFGVEKDGIKGLLNMLGLKQ